MSESKVVKKGSCDRCGSSDANVLYEGGTKFCFSCRTYSKGDDMEQVTKPISINSNHQNFSLLYVKVRLMQCLPMSYKVLSGHVFQ